MLNNSEGYLLEENKCGKVTISNLPQLNNERRYIRSIFFDESKTDGKHFLILVSKEYDKKFEIIHSKYSRDDFYIEVKQ